MKSINNNLEKIRKSVDNLKSNVNALKNAYDSDAVKFDGLGFTLKPDVVVWIEVNVNPCTYGWIYDYHVLMQAVWANISSKDLVKRLTKGYKLYINFFSPISNYWIV